MDTRLIDLRQQTSSINAGSRTTEQTMPNTVTFSPTDWYDFLVHPACEVMLAYVRRTEEQVAAGIADFQQNKQSEVIEEIDDYALTVEHHDGFVQGFWDLAMLFERDLPNIQRRSALITLYSFFEHELDKLCGLLAKLERYALALKDIQGKGIDRSARFLEKVAGLTVSCSTATWAEIKNIQSIRNAITHANGLIGTDSKVLTYIEASEYLSLSGCNILIAQGYLAYVLDVFQKHFRAVNAALDKKYA